MAEWPAATLESVCALITDGSHYSPKTVSSGWPYVTVRNIGPNGIVFEDCEFVDEETFLELRKAGCSPHRGDVLFSKDGTVGKVAVNDTDREFVVLSSLAILRPDSARVSSAYLALALSSSAFQSEATQQKTGLAIKRVVLKNLRTMTIPVPPLSVQRRMVNLIGTIDNHIALLVAEADAAAAMAVAVRADLMRPTEGWTESALEGLAEIFDGPHATPTKTEHGPWYLSISSLVQGRVDLAASAHLSPQEHVTWTRRVSPRRGDTLFSYETRLGEAGYWDSDEPAALGRRMGLLRPRPEQVVPKFLMHLYLAPAFQSLIDDRAVRGSTVDRIPIAKIGGWPVAVPGLDEQQRIVATLDAATGQEHLLRQEALALQQVRSTLLTALLTGEADIDRSYDVLLEAA